MKYYLISYVNTVDGKDYILNDVIDISPAKWLSTALSGPYKNLIHRLVFAIEITQEEYEDLYEKV